MPGTKHLEQELTDLPDVLKGLTLKGKLELLKVYEKQLALVNEMRNMTGAAAREDFFAEHREMMKQKIELKEAEK